MRNQFRTGAAGALFSGLLLVLATPPIPLGFLAWLGLVPFMLAMERVESTRDAIRLGMLLGLVFHAGTIYWLAMNTGADMTARVLSGVGGVLLFTVWFGIVSIPYKWALDRFGRAGHFALILIWPAQELFWSYGEMAFPWALLALTQAEYLPILQLSAVGGTSLVTAWVAAVNALAVVGREKRRTGLVLILMLAMTWAGGAIRQHTVLRSTMSRSLGYVGLAQGNVDPSDKWELGAKYSVDIYTSLTRSLAETHELDLMVWPETAAPVRLQHSRYWKAVLQDFVDSLDVPLTTGASHREYVDGEKIPYNASFLLTPGAGGRMEYYAKVHLVPFGERVPFQWLFPGLGELNLGQAEFRPGPGIVAWPVRRDTLLFHAGPLICYEDIFPHLAHRCVHEGADILVNQTNDGWLHGTSEQRQHLLLARFRSLETGRTLVRATNTGISAIFAPSGHFLAELPIGVRGAVGAEAPGPLTTPYLRGGWLLKYLFGGAALILWMVMAVERIRNRRREKREAL